MRKVKTKTLRQVREKREKTKLEEQNSSPQQDVNQEKRERKDEKTKLEDEIFTLKREVHREKRERKEEKTKLEALQREVSREKSERKEEKTKLEALQREVKSKRKEEKTKLEALQQEVNREKSEKIKLEGQICALEQDVNREKSERKEEKNKLESEITRLNSILQVTTPPKEFISFLNNFPKLQSVQEETKKLKEKIHTLETNDKIKEEKVNKLESKIAQKNEQLLELESAKENLSATIAQHEETLKMQEKTFARNLQATGGIRTDGDESQMRKKFNSIRNDEFVDFFEIVSDCTVNIDKSEEKKLWSKLNNTCYIGWSHLLEVAKLANEDSFCLANNSCLGEEQKKLVIEAFKKHVLKAIPASPVPPKLDEATQKLCSHLVDLFILMEVNNPRMKFIEVRNGDHYNPEQHISADDNHSQIILTGMKEPGIVSTFDRTVIEKAIVYTTLRSKNANK